MFDSTGVTACLFPQANTKLRITKNKIHVKLFICFTLQIRGKMNVPDN